MMDTDLPPGASNSTGHLSTIGYGTAPGRMHHSQSTPAGVDGAGGASRTPPATPKKGGKMLAVRVQMLDDTISMFQVQSKALGRVLFEQVCRQLHLLEADYFGLEYQEVNGTKFWLDLEKGMCRQVGLSLVDPLLRFCVKFYTPDPARLEEEFTRYLFCLQIKRDLAHGCIQCNENTAALMASYIVQAECGDFVPEDYPDHTYLSGYKFFPQQDADLEQRIMENHKKHAGQSPAEADMNLLETARRCELYGMQMHPAKDHENVPLNLAVAHLGIVVFQNFTKINTFSWAKIRKISFKRKRFLVKLHPEGYGYYKDVVEFFFEGRNECKNFWKKCVENHGFFRCSSVKRVPRQRTRVLSRGSSFRYSGKTQKQIVEFVRDNYVKRQTFQRSQSFRASHSLRSSRANVSTPSAPINASLSAHPLLPLPPGSDAISVEWDKQPHYLEASLMMRGYTETEARAALGAERRRSEGAQLARPPSTPTTFTAMRDRERGIVTRAEVNHHHMAESPPPLPMTTPLDSPGSTWSQLTYQHNTATNTAGDPIRAPPVPVATTQDQDVSSPGEGDTTSTGSFYLFPMSPMPTNHMGYGRTAPSGGVSVDNIASQDKKQKISSDVNENVEVTDGVQTKGNVVIGRGGLESQSIHSMDVLSGGESDAADTLSRPQKLFDSGTMCKSTMGGVERRKKWMGNPDFFATKELLMTERAYKKDLEVITMWWSQLVSEGVSLGWLSSGHAEALGRPCLAVESVALAAASLLPQVDACFTAMDTTIDSQNIEDTTSISQILRDHLRENLSIYEEYILRGGYLVGRVETARRGDGGAERVCCSLEASRAPLPLATHLLRPLHRILYYGETLQRLAANEEDVWKEEDKTVLSHLVELGKTQLLHAENHAHLCQLQRDITGYDNLLVAGREFIRMGCLFKNSNKGLLQRMFFLFSDTLLYASKTSGTSEQLFRVHSAIPLHSVQLQPADYANAFILHYEGSVLTLSANSVEERVGWWRDLTEGAAAACDTSEDTQPQNISKQNAVHTSIDDLTHSGSQGTGVGVSLAHVCWHRCTSLTRAQLHLASRTQLSGYLLRKFKNSHGWQKLWVVYAVFALYFYKGWQDNLPLASLPLLGYNVTTPNERDGINKDFVFKLVFKNHVYFFRAESEHTYNRWMEVIRTAMTTQ